MELLDRLRRVFSYHRIWPPLLVGSFASGGLGLARAGIGGGYQIFYWAVLATSFLWLFSATKSSISADRARHAEQVLGLALSRISLLEGKLIEAGQTPESMTRNWPWGTHHTEALSHLEAAANRFWKLYDPTDDSTAPTNKQVSDWLQSERKVSAKMADSIASILRADGLPTGPRK